ncbi:AI-2E family transporter [Cellulomonas endophytica]|uniref:AI-2E family transporter n=1 Tax=Cellulomonas endophytica TaxID=2494735 RepID=UPI0010126AD8|nr:AI-2E family transporter [Cellulomonas endophytica]
MTAPGSATGPATPVRAAVPTPPALRRAPDPRRPPRWLPRALVMAVVTVFVGISVWRAIGQLGNVLTIVVIAWFLALAMEPLIVWLVHHRWRRGLATGAVMFGSLVLVAGVLTLFGGLFVEQLVALVQSLPALYADLVDLADDRFGLDLPPVDELLTTVAGNWQTFTPSLLGLGTSLAGGLFTATAVLLVTYYMAAAGPRFRAAVCRYFAPARQREVLRVWEVSQEKVAGFLSSRILLAVFSSVATFVVLTVLKVPYAVPMAVFTGLVSQFVPTIGTYIGGALPVLVALTVSPVAALVVVVFIVAYQQVENLVLSPRVSQRSLELHPAMAFLAVLAFGAVFGALGAFLSLPVAATIQAASSTYVRRHEFVDPALLEEDAGGAVAVAAPAADEQTGTTTGTTTGTGSGATPAPA